MLTIYGDIYSGNCYKIRLLCAFLNIEHQWKHVDILKGESRSESFLAWNPNGKVPCVRLANDNFLWESNAILNYLASGSAFLPSDRLLNAQVLQWQFFEQYSHEPFIATARYIKRYLGLPEDRLAEFEAKQAGGQRALSVMEKHLFDREWFVGNTPTIADISLFAYTHVADEGGFSLDDYPSIRKWLVRFVNMPGFASMDEFAERIG